MPRILGETSIPVLPYPPPPVPANPPPPPVAASTTLHPGVIPPPGTRYRHQTAVAARGLLRTIFAVVQAVGSLIVLAVWALTWAFGNPTTSAKPCECKCVCQPACAATEPSPTRAEGAVENPAAAEHSLPQASTIPFSHRTGQPGPPVPAPPTERQPIPAHGGTDLRNHLGSSTGGPARPGRLQPYAAIEE
jgi:hypothetical protein